MAIMLTPEEEREVRDLGYKAATGIATALNSGGVDYEALFARLDVVTRAIMLLSETKQ